MVKKYLSVQQFNEYISGIFADDAYLHQVSVCGEASGISVVNGAAYFTLKDKNAMLSVICFNCGRTYLPKDGESIIVTGRADFYVKGGKLSLNAYRIVPVGMGDIQRRLEQLKEKLRKEGLFDASHKKQIPLYPQKIAIITSLQGAALQDMLTTVYSKNTVQEITVVDVRVQGEYAAADITNAIKNADNANFDVIIVARGGGSLEDLFPFNDEGLLRAIYEAKSPIITAVGHETDYMLCDFVADERAITPTAAAERVAFDIDALKLIATNSILSLKSAMNERLERSFRRMREIKQIMHFRYASFIRTEVKDCELARSNLKVKLNNKILHEESKMQSLLKLLSAKNPVRLLQEGYFRAEKEGLPLNSVSGLTKGDTIRIYGGDGTVDATVETVTALRQESMKY